MLKSILSDLQNLATQLMHLRQWRQRSLVVDSAFRMLLAGLGLGIIFALTNWALIRQQESQRLTGYVTELLSTVESSVKVACFTRDRILAEEVTKGLLANRMVAGIRITSGSEVLIEKIRPGTDWKSAGSADVTRMPVMSPFSNDEKVGEVELLADVRFIQAQADRYSSKAAMILLFEVIAVGFAVAMVALRTVMLQIRLLSEAASLAAVDSGEIASYDMDQENRK